MEKTIKSIKDYVRRTKISDDIKRRYDLSMNEALSIRLFYNQNSYNGLLLAYNFGMARGYRAAKAEARR